MGSFVKTSRRLTRLNGWKIIAQRARHARSWRPFRALIGTSLRRILRRVGSIRRLTSCNNVDLPAPERKDTDYLPG
jgi:hypothetical protein